MAKIHLPHEEVWNFVWRTYRSGEFDLDDLIDRGQYGASCIKSLRPEDFVDSLMILKARSVIEVIGFRRYKCISSFDEHDLVPPLTAEQGKKVEEEIGAASQRLHALLSDDKISIPDILKFGAFNYRLSEDAERAMLKKISQMKREEINQYLPFGRDYLPLYMTTMMHLAVWYRSAKMIEKLIELEADFNIPNRGNTSALELAINLRGPRSKNEDDELFYSTIIGLIEFSNSNRGGSLQDRHHEPNESKHPDTGVLGVKELPPWWKFWAR